MTRCADEDSTPEGPGLTSPPSTIEIAAQRIADLLTKPLDKTMFLSLHTLLMTGSNEVP